MYGVNVSASGYAPCLAGAAAALLHQLGLHTKHIPSLDCAKKWCFRLLIALTLPPSQKATADRSLHQLGLHTKHIPSLDCGKNGAFARL